ncbi:hypothetical protein WG66_002663 [Moniliophthora roreri]|nr:hypothetical protein WG66_002663 [Moniliophthora roreri]
MRISQFENGPKRNMDDSVGGGNPDPRSIRNGNSSDMRRIGCEICGGTCYYLDSLHTWKEVRGVVEEEAFLMSISDWLTYIVEPPRFQSSRHQPSRSRYLEDLLACLVTHVDHYRSEKWDSTHEIIVAHLCYVTICEDHPAHKYNYTLVRSFTVPVDGSFNILDCVSLAESVSRLIQPYSSQPWTSMWWAATFFHCARERCGATKIRRGLAFSRRGCLGSLRLVNDKCEIRVFDTESEREMDKAMTRMTMGTLKQKLFAAWSGFLKAPVQMDEFKVAFYGDQAKMREAKSEDDIREDPRKQVLAGQVEILRVMVAKLGGLCNISKEGTVSINSSGLEGTVSMNLKV